MIGLLGTFLSVLLAAGPVPWDRPATGVEPTTQATSQPAAASQPAELPEGGNVKDRLRQLWRESLQPPTATPTASDKLRETMDELRRIRVSPRLRGKAPLAAVVGEPASRPGEPVSRPSAGDANDAAQAATAGLSPAVVEKLKGIPSGSLASPADLADDLYQGGHLAAAAAMYERAMTQGDDDTKAWALYQTANCRRTAKPQEAETLYLRVISEYSKTPWAKLAAVEQKLLEWQRVNRPMELLDSLATVGRAGATTRATSQLTTRRTTQPATMPEGAKTQATQPQLRDGTVTVRTKTSSASGIVQTRPIETVEKTPESETVVPRIR
jgi:hypothetical protein